MLFAAEHRLAEIMGTFCLAKSDIVAAVSEMQVYVNAVHTSGLKTEFRMRGKIILKLPESVNVIADAVSFDNLLRFIQQADDMGLEPHVYAAIYCYLCHVSPEPKPVVRIPAEWPNQLRLSDDHGMS
jgi:hypothetical protein